MHLGFTVQAADVALLAEGVDRNLYYGRKIGMDEEVALLAEGVDRNRRYNVCLCFFPDVALLAEGVDRNFEASGLEYNADRRPPRGGRG